MKISKIMITCSIFASGLVLGGCVKKTITIQNDNSNSENQDKTTIETIAQILTVDGNRCRGCGKCMRIDPEHFEMNHETRKAMVISSKNLGSSNLNLAIQNCRDNAISLK